MKTAHGTPETKIIVSGSFARALSAMAKLLKGKRDYVPSFEVTSTWFSEGPPVQYAQYHIETLKPYVENHLTQED